MIFQTNRRGIVGIVTRTLDVIWDASIQFAHLASSHRPDRLFRVPEAEQAEVTCRVQFGGPPQMDHNSVRASIGPFWKNSRISRRISRYLCISFDLKYSLILTAGRHLGSFVRIVPSNEPDNDGFLWTNLVWITQVSFADDGSDVTCQLIGTHPPISKSEEFSVLCEQLIMFIFGFDGD